MTLGLLVLLGIAVLWQKCQAAEQRKESSPRRWAVGTGPIII